MQYVNDDMDELFRKAAKDYSLNTGSADWEKVQKALEEPPAGEARRAGKGDRWHLLWLLLLLPLPWICTQLTGEGEKGIADAPGVRTEAPGPAGKYTPSAQAPKNTITGPGGSSHTGEASQPSLMATTAIKEPVAVFKAEKKDRFIIDHNRREAGEVGLPINTSDKQESVPDAGEKEVTAEKTGAPLASAEAKVEDTAATKIAADTSAIVPPGQKKESAPRPRRFYAGVIGGADITSVEMQKVKKAGYDLGGVVGYSINERWSVEAGLLSSEKAYYSSGEHLYNAYTLPGAKLLEAEGDCRMWEVPLVVRYRFSPGKRSGWFAAVGSSSYFMQKESYDYTYYYMATGQEVKRSRSYPSDSRHLFAAAQLSGGYSRRLGKAVELRVEPYLKLPLRKVGYYELPLTSFGVHAGVTRKLF